MIDTSRMIITYLPEMHTSRDMVPGLLYDGRMTLSEGQVRFPKCDFDLEWVGEKIDYAEDQLGNIVHGIIITDAVAVGPYVYCTIIADVVEHNQDVQ